MTMDTPLTFFISDNNMDCIGFCKDLSHTGIKFVADRKPSIGDQLKIMIDTKHSSFEPFKAEVEVLRSEFADNKYIVAGKILKYN